MIKLIFLAFLFYIGYSVLRFVLRIFFAVNSVRKEEAKKVDGAQMHLDPACGIYVASETAVIAKIAGEQHYFCSEECRDTYKKEQKK